MKGYSRKWPYTAQHLPRKLGEEVITEVADHVAKKETLASQIRNIH